MDTKVCREDTIPGWLGGCKVAEGDMEEVCGACVHKKECNEFLKPLVEAIERWNEIGEV